jgi:3-(methylthio)propanoyl-CoA dehydrogenase
MVEITDFHPTSGLKQTNKRFRGNAIMPFAAPLRDIRFALDTAGQLSEVASLFPDTDPAGLVEAVLDEAGKLAAGTLAPLNAPGDRAGVHLENGIVRSAPGFADAYQEFVAGGWQGVAADATYGGQGLPKVMSLAVHEMLHAANMSFALCPMLTLGAIEALEAHGTEQQKRVYLPKLVTGEWTGTMNLTEPQAGSDVGALTSKAEPVGDGSYKIKGQKIYITWGEHDMARNVIHLVLARTPNAPEGSRGISLFLVPKFIPNAAGEPGHRNDLRCIGLEKKMGIHASPTCTMAFGEDEGAIGWLIGEENKGLACMFTMMNSARLNVGLQGVAIGEAAFQKALEWAQDRRQGKAVGDAGSGASPIIGHADVRRMLMTMKARVGAARAICYATAAAADLAIHHADPEVRARAKLREEVLTPIAKAWSTDMGVEVASLGVQIHGGMGFVEEGGAAQFYRDARIASIYEGTNGIQAIDLVGRKLSMDGGSGVDALIDEARSTAAECSGATDQNIRWIGERLTGAAEAFLTATEWMKEAAKGAEKRDVLAGATPYLRLAGDTIGGAMLAQQALEARRRIEAGEGNPGYLSSRVALAGYYAENVLAAAPGLVPAITQGASALFEPELEALAG